MKPHEEFPALYAVFEDIGFVEPEKAFAEWIDKSHPPALEGRTPRQALADGERWRVSSMLLALAEGSYL